MVAVSGTTRYRQAAWQAADRGARLLDARLPDWPTTLELESFSIGSGDQCVIGQLAHRDMTEFYTQVGLRLGEGSYSWGVAMLMDRPDLAPRNVDPDARSHSDLRRDWAARYGFDLPRGGAAGYGWDDLQEAWIWQIAQRRQLAPADALRQNWYSASLYHISRIEVPWPDGEVPAGDA